MASRKKNAAVAAPAEKKEETKTPDHGVKDVKTMLLALGDGWGDTEEQSSSDVPDGKYQCKIDEATVGASKSSGRLQVNWQMTIVSGPNKNRKIFKHDGLDTPENRGWFRGGLARLGVEWPASPKDLPTTVSGLKDTYCQVTAKTKGDSDRQNIYFDKALDKGDIGESAIPKDSDKPKPKGDERPADKKKETDPDERPSKTVEKEEAAGDEDDELKVDTKFTDDDMTPRQMKAIEELAKKKEYDPSDYSSKTDLLADIAENEFTVEGVFDNAQDLLNACSK